MAREGKAEQVKAEQGKSKALPGKKQQSNLRQSKAGARSAEARNSGKAKVCQEEQSKAEQGKTKRSKANVTSWRLALLWVPSVCGGESGGPPFCVQVAARLGQWLYPDRPLPSLLHSSQSTVTVGKNHVLL